MIGKPLLSIALISLLAPAGQSRELMTAAAADMTDTEIFALQTSPVELSITDLKLNPATGNPNSVDVTWAVRKRDQNAKLEGYEITLELLRKDVSEKIMQRFNSEATTFAVSLSGIAADKRARIFAPSDPRAFSLENVITARAILKAKFNINGQRGQVEAKTIKSLRPPARAFTPPPAIEGNFETAGEPTFKTQRGVIKTSNFDAHEIQRGFRFNPEPHN